MVFDLDKRLVIQFVTAGDAPNSLYPVEEHHPVQRLPMPVAQMKTVAKCNICEANAEQIKMIADKLDTFLKDWELTSKKISAVLTLPTPPPCLKATECDNEEKIEYKNQCTRL